jgi:hypothetical protein
VENSITNSPNPKAARPAIRFNRALILTPQNLLQPEMAINEVFGETLLKSASI